jgi:crotonobetainyl-CoA:carnitine CoA-transferase CaiB-like acyl-CoA transferase
MSHGPLHGIRVLEFSVILAGPFAGLHLSDLGADVIKVESLDGDPTRNLAAVVPGHSKQFQWRNRGKRSLALNLKDARGRAIVHRLVEDMDVVLINYRPGVAKRLGIDYETLSAIRPDLIYADITGFGTSGPLADLAAGDIVAQAYAGATALGGKLDDEGAPEWVRIPVADMPTGMAAAMAILAALFHRARTGEGQRVSVSLLRTMMAILGGSIMREPISDSANRDPIMAEVNRVRAEGGSYAEVIAAHRGTAPPNLPYNLYFRAYRAKDGEIALGANTPANRAALRKAIGVEGDPSDTPDFDPSNPANRELLLTLRQQIGERLRACTVAEWMERFAATGAPGGPVNLPEDLADDPQGSTMMVEVEHPITGPQRQVGPILDMSKTPTAIAGPAPSLGADTERILADSGFTDDDIAALRADGVLG